MILWLGGDKDSIRSLIWFGFAKSEGVLSSTAHMDLYFKKEIIYPFGGEKFQKTTPINSLLKIPPKKLLK